MCASYPSNLINAKMFFRNCFKQCSYFITFSSAFICFKISLRGRPRIQRQLEVELELERVIYVISTRYVIIAEKLDIIYCPPPSQNLYWLSFIIFKMILKYWTRNFRYLRVLYLENLLKTINYVFFYLNLMPCATEVYSIKTWSSNSCEIYDVTFYENVHFSLSQELWMT